MFVCLSSLAPTNCAHSTHVSMHMRTHASTHRMHARTHIIGAIGSLELLVSNGFFFVGTSQVEIDEVMYIICLADSQDGTPSG